MSEDRMNARVNFWVGVRVMVRSMFLCLVWSSALGLYLVLSLELGFVMEEG